MNKKAIFAYVVLFVFVVLGSYYVYHSDYGGASSTSTVQTTAYSNTTTTGSNSTDSSTSTVGPTNLSYTYSTTTIPKSTGGSSGSSGSGQHGVSNSSCAASQEYTCTSIGLSHVTGRLTIGFEQQTGLVWSSAHVFFLNQSQEADVQQYSTYSKSGALLLNVTPGEPVSASVQVTPANVSVGTQAMGEMWVAYQTRGNSTIYYGEIASIDIKAT